MSPIQDLQTALTASLVPGRKYNVRAGTGLDMTDEINGMWSDSAMDGRTMIFENGVYKISNTCVLARPINVFFNNAVFELDANTPSTTFSPGIPENHDGVKYLTIAEREAGTLANRAAMIWGISGGQRPTRNWIKGNLKITRTAANNTAAARLHCGLVMLAPFEVDIDVLEVVNFFGGVVCMGGPSGEGFAYNVVDKIKALNCRYPLTIYSNRSTSSYANQNEFRGGRLFHDSTIHADTTYNSAQWEAIRVLWESGGTTPAPANGNRFGPITIEGEWGRKIRLEGRDNEFNWLRYEDTHPSQTIEILDDTDVNNDPLAGVWDTTGGVAVTTLATCTADGTLTQQSSSFVTAITASTGYKLTYSAVSTGFTGSLALSGVCNNITGLPITTGTHEVTFSTKSSPGDLTLIFVRTAGTLTVDNISLKAMPDITIGEVSRTNSFFSRNLFLGGDSLSTILALNNVEFLSSGGGNGLNNANTFIGGKANFYGARVDSGDVVTTAHRFGTTSSTGPVIAVCNSSALELIKMYHVYSGLSAQGALEFLDTTLAIRNAIGMNTASPYDFQTTAGLNIANRLRVRVDTTDSNAANVGNPVSGGQILIPTGTGLVKIWNNSDDADILIIADNGRDARIAFRARDTTIGSGNTFVGVLRFYDDDATPTYRNALCLHGVTSLPGGAGSHPIVIEKGLWVNEGGFNADTQISSDTQAECFYLDASALSGAGAVGIGTATPDSKFHVVGKIHGSDELELDGALNHDGTTLGVYGAAPVTQPTVTGSRSGNAALASLLTALASQGIVIDSSTA